jgi:hypothetical protein
MPLILTFPPEEKGFYSFFLSSTRERIEVRGT